VARAKWCGPEIYDAVVAFKERCLVADDSLFAAGSAGWTPAHVHAVAERVGVEDLGSGSFIEKLESQLDGLDPIEVQLGAELLYVLLLPELDTSGSKKREHVSRILGMLPEPVGLPSELDAALDAGGVANFAAAKAYRDAGLRFLAKLFIRLKNLPEHDRRSVLDAPWDFRALVGEVRTSTDAMQANAFLHLMFPEHFEYMVSEGHREKLIQAFQAAPGVGDADNPDRKIARIRELAGVGGDPDLDLYEDPFQRIWKEEAPPRWIEAADWSRRLYVRDDFDETERHSKLRVASKMVAARDAVLSHSPEWLEALRAAFTDSRNNLTDWRAHDPFLQWCEGHEADASRLLQVLWGGEEDTSSNLHAFLDQLPREAVAGPGTRVSIASFLLLGIDATRYPFFKPTVYSDFKKLLGVAAAEAIEIDPESVYRPEELAARLGLDGRRVREFLRTTYPRDAREHGSAWYLSPEQAQRVIDEFADEIDVTRGDATYADWTALLDELRLRMLAVGTPLRDLLDAQGLAWWLVRRPPPEDWDQADRAAFEAFRKGGTAPTVTPTIEESSVQAGSADVALPAVTPDLAARLHLPESWLQRLLGLLAEKKQLILYGPPGTGKTFVAQHIGHHISAHGGSSRLVQFHPSYTYEDFFEGYRPRHHAGGALSFDLVPGALREIASDAENNPGVPHLLIIDEINRGNIAKIFGELYFLLEYRDESIRLQYSRDEEFRLPQNLFFIGTMNTADRSIALVDSALRRRFYFMGLIPTRPPVERVLADWLAANELPPEPAVLLAELNRTIDDEDFAIGPSYFMTKDATAPDLERIWAHAVMPLLEEHYYGTGRELDTEFGLAAIRKRIAAAADATEAAPDDD
jgi:MoxR-like ATPase